MQAQLTRQQTQSTLFESRIGECQWFDSLNSQPPERQGRHYMVHFLTTEAYAQWQQKHTNLAVLFVILCRNNASGLKVFVSCETCGAASSGCGYCTRAARRLTRQKRIALGESRNEERPNVDNGEARQQMIRVLLEYDPSGWRAGFEGSTTKQKGYPPIRPLILRCKRYRMFKLHQALFHTTVHEVTFQKIRCSLSSPTSNLIFFH